MNDELWVVKSRITGNLLDAGVHLFQAQERRDEMNRIYQTNEYIVERFRVAVVIPDTTQGDSNAN